MHSVTCSDAISGSVPRLILLHVPHRLFASVKCPDGDDFAWDVIENVSSKFSENASCVIVDLSRLAWHSRKNFVIFLAVFDLLHQAQQLTIHDLPCAQRSGRQHKTIHVVSISRGSIEHEA